MVLLMVSRIVTSTAGLYSPCILLLQSIPAIGRDRDGSLDGKYIDTTPTIVQIKKVSA